MNLSSEIVKQKAFELGADLCGIAPIERFEGLSEMADPKKILPSAKSVVVVAKKFLGATAHSSSSVPYTIVRNNLSRGVDDLTVNLAYFFDKNGYEALPTGAIEPCNRSVELEKTMGLISLKNAAHLAGLGVIGKNTLLVTPKYGNMVWLGGIITSAPLVGDPIIEHKLCTDDCRICIDACPVQAIDGSLFMNQAKCWNSAFGVPETGGEWRIKCYKCRVECPYTNGFEINGNGR